MTLFDDRREAGEKLSEHLKEKVEIDAVVVPYPESIDVGLEVASRFSSKIEMRMSDFITSPDKPYAELGAVTEDGTLWVQDDLKRELEVTGSYLENMARIKSNLLKEKSDKFGKGHDLKGNSVVIVSDGIGNGFREASVAGSLLKEGVENIHVAAPVVSRNIRANILSVVDRIYFIREIPFLSSPDASYKVKASEKRHKSGIA